MRFDVLTLFPDLFQGYFTQSLLKLAIQKGLVEIHLPWNLRSWAAGKHRQRRLIAPFGGGPGMVLMPEPVFAAVEAIRKLGPEPGEVVMRSTPGGRATDAGDREGAVDRETARSPVRPLRGLRRADSARLAAPSELSIGDYICNGGEVPAMVVIDTVIRYVPGVLGDEESVTEESHSIAGKLEYPQYTRPRSFRGMEVPGDLDERRPCGRRQVARNTVGIAIRSEGRLVPCRIG